MHFAQVSFLREGKVRAQDVQWTSVLCGPKRSEEIVELARRISERAREREKLAKRVSHRNIRKGYDDTNEQITIYFGVSNGGTSR